MRYTNNRKYREDSLSKKSSNVKKFDFIKKKENTLHSLYEVEHFLCNMKKVFKSIKLYNLFK